MCLCVRAAESAYFATLSRLEKNKAASLALLLLGITLLASINELKIKAKPEDFAVIDTKLTNLKARGIVGEVTTAALTEFCKEWAREKRNLAPELKPSDMAEVQMMATIVYKDVSLQPGRQPRTKRATKLTAHASTTDRRTPPFC